RGRQQDAAEDLERRRLARAVEAEEADHFAAVDRELQIVNRRQLAVVFGQAFDFNHVRGRFSVGGGARKSRDRSNLSAGIFYSRGGLDLRQEADVVYGI